VAAETPRILELRRRVQSDPSSIAFAQLAEEYRRAGNYDEAINCCRTGLARHPGYLSARVTLGRALMETAGLDEATREFELVLRTAPENLAAIRGMAEIHHRGGALAQALEYYKRALELARHDPELEETVNQIVRELGSVTPSPSGAGAGMSFAEAHSELLSAGARMPDSQEARSPLPLPEAPVKAAEAAAPAAPMEPLIDFDALLLSLGVPDASPPPAMAALLSDAVTPSERTDPVVPDLPIEPVAGDPFAALERELRAYDDARSSLSPEAQPPADGRKEPAAPAVLDELEAWLDALTSDRARQDNSGSSSPHAPGYEGTERQTS
jgi:tetratricopeptide (TPR) repeat protein